MSAPTGTRANDLARWLNGLGLPVYALDDQRRIVFANAALAAWAGIEAKELLHQRCDYVSDSPVDGPAAAAGALAPPPEVFHGARVVVDRVPPTGVASQRRSIEFIPLVVDGTCQGVWAVVHAEPPLAAPADEAAELHERLRGAQLAWREQHAIGRLVGDSPALKQVRAQVAAAAACRASVVIVGPPGSGRRTVARTIHSAADPKAVTPLFLLDGATLTGEQLRAQRASWTARLGDRSGTLLLTEVDTLPADAQADLAAFIAGSNEKFRILSTAASSLTTRVAAGEFREDLACALSTSVISLPGLAERRTDVPLLAQAILEQHNATGGKQLAGFASDALDALAAYPWPGNVAELVSIVAECQTTADGPLVSWADLPKRIQLSMQAAARPKRALEPIELEAVLANIERELIQRALADAKQNKSRAAKLLGLTRPRLYRRMVQLGLEHADEK